jgi:ABC-2 type transport system ATP-binding protein
MVAKNLFKSFGKNGKPALANASFETPAGTVTGLAGPDGAGKTTLARLLTGLLDRDRGELSVLGVDPGKDPGKLRSFCGYLPQKFGLYGDLTVLENLGLYAELRGLPRGKAKERIAALLDFVGLADFGGRPAQKLSGGMKQKLALASALMGNPRLLVLDEPTAGVDPVSRRELLKMVGDLAKEGLTVLWATSYLDEAGKCDGVILLNEGKVIYAGTPEKAKETVTSGSFEISGLGPGERRKALLSLLESDSVEDGVMLGSVIRVLTPDGDAERARTILSGTSAVFRRVPPNFEDAFVSFLSRETGVKIKKKSELSRRTAHKTRDREVTVEAKNLRKNFGGFEAVKGIGFSIKRGEIFGLLGPNGAGKSTTFKMLCGLSLPSGGSSSVMGEDMIAGARKAKARLGYMAQKFSLYDLLTVEQNLRFFSGAYGLHGKAQRDETDLMRDIFNFTPHLKTPAGLLPLGHKQRLALASCVMHEPDVLFLDEPTSGVDPITRREFWLHINYLATTGVSVLVSTHFMDEAEHCDRVALIHGGEIIAEGSPDELKALAAGPDLPNPTLEDAFATLVARRDMSEKEGERTLSPGKTERNERDGAGEKIEMNDGDEKIEKNEGNEGNEGNERIERDRRTPGP